MSRAVHSQLLLHLSQAAKHPYMKSSSLGKISRKKIDFQLSSITLKGLEKLQVLEIQMENCKRLVSKNTSGDRSITFEKTVRVLLLEELAVIKAGYFNHSFILQF